jgi:glutamate-1-semialdehyde 2,1-aminomutase
MCVFLDTGPVTTAPTSAPADITAAVAAARAAYAAANPRSAERDAVARRSMPGGNTRTTLYYEPFPLVFTGGQGAHLTSLDGRRYTDFLGEFTAGLYGHSHPVILRRIHEVLDAGVTLGGHNDYEARFSAELQRRFPSLELLRFTNSGTEANLMALAAATAYTGRRGIVVFRGGYHGGGLSFAAGNGPTNVPHAFHVADYNNVAGAAALIRQLGDGLAAVLVEPMLGSGGNIPATPEFLGTLRAETERAGALLILDEVMTSRLSIGGVQRRLGIDPDLTVLGKYLGGGMSFGAFGGRADIMSHFDPSHPDAWPHAGTFNNNVLTMAAGLAGLEEVLHEDVITELNQRGDRLRDALNAVFSEADAPLQALGIGSLMTIHAVTGEVTSPADFARARDDIKELLFLHLVEEGFWLARRALIALSIAVTDDDCAALVASVRRFTDRYASLLRT